MRRIRELTGHEKFTPLHAAILVFCLDGLCCCSLRAAGMRMPVLALAGTVGFLLASWYGILLLAWHRGTPYPLLVGVLLISVNVIWGAWLFLMRDPQAPLRDEHLACAAILCGLGLLMTLASLLARRRAHFNRLPRN